MAGTGTKEDARLFEAVALAHEPTPGYTLSAVLVYTIWVAPDESTKERLLVHPPKHEQLVRDVCAEYLSWVAEQET